MATNSVTRYQRQTVTRLPDLVDRLFRESFGNPAFWDRSFAGTVRPSLPANLFETSESYVLHVSLPGMKPENFDISVVGREVTIKGKLEITSPEGGDWIWQGIPSGEFFESFTLPL